MLDEKRSKKVIKMERLKGQEIDTVSDYQQLSRVLLIAVTSYLFCRIGSLTFLINLGKLGKFD